MIDRQQFVAPLNGLAGLSLVGSVCLLTWALFWPITPTLDIVSTLQTQASSGKESSPQSTTDTFNVDTGEAGLEPLLTVVDWNRRLRSAPTPPTETVIRVTETPPPKPTSKREPTLDWTLLGTILEEGNSFALMQDRLGNIDLQPVGGTLQLAPKGWQVSEIQKNTVRVVQADEQFIVRLRTRNSSSDTQPKATQKLNQLNVPVRNSEPGPMDLNNELEWLNGTRPPSVNDQ